MNVLLKPISFLFIMLLGYGLKKCKIVKEKDAQILMKIIMNVTLPMTVLHAFSSFSDDPTLLWIVLLGLLCALLPFLTLYRITNHKMIATRAFYMINVSGYNIGCFTLPLIQTFFGSFGAMIACMFDTGNAIMMTGGSYALSTTLLYSNHYNFDYKNMLMKFVKSIPFDAYMFMLLISVCHLQLPNFVLVLSEPIANANSFLAMLMIGIMLEIKINKLMLLESMKLLIYRVIFAIVFMIFIYLVLPFSWEIKRILMIVVFAPISTLAPLYTLKCKGNAELASLVNSLSILLSMIIMCCLSLYWL